MNIFSTFFSVPILLNLLGSYKYGVWLTIYSVVGWFSVFDLGLGNGFKLYLTEAFSSNKISEIRPLISSTYFIVSVISCSLICLFFISSLFIDWEIFMGLTLVRDYELYCSISFLSVSILILFILKLVSDIYYSFQVVYVDGLIKSLGQIVFLLIAYFFIVFNMNVSIFELSVYSIIPTLFFYFLLTFYFFGMKSPSLIWSFRFISREKIKLVFKPGVFFFVIQLSSIILYSTDNLLISKLISPEAVTTYSISYRVFGVPFLFYTLYISTHWSSFIDALTKNQFEWIKARIRLFKILFIPLIFVYFVLFFSYDIIIEIWLPNEQIKSDHFLNLSMIFYYLVSAFTTIYIYVVNASGKLFIQMVSYFVIAIINIPISIFFVQGFNLGSSGVILASAFCLLILLFLMPYQSYLVLNQRTYGVWEKK